MQKLKKQSYMTKKQGEKVNNYYVTISKDIISQTNITTDDYIKVYSHDNKIIIEKSE